VTEGTLGTAVSGGRPRHFVLVAAMCLVLGGLGGLVAASVTDPSGAGAAPVRFIPPEGQAFDFSLRDQDGKVAQLADARGEVVALSWMYTSCRDLCPAEATVMAEAMRQVGDGVRAYIVSVDPDGDTPERARAWLERRGWSDGSGRFLLGSREQLEPIWRAYAIAPLNATREEALAAAKAADEFRAMAAAQGQTRPRRRFEYTPPEREAAPAASDPFPSSEDLLYRGPPRHIAGLGFEHTAYVMLIDKQGNQRVGLPFEQLEAAELAADMRTLLKEP
jgi:protein SCO1